MSLLARTPTDPNVRVATLPRAQYARYMGYDVIAVDSGKQKQDLCTSLGADHFLDFKEVVRAPLPLPPSSGGRG